jgi:hypothetical protein
VTAASPPSRLFRYRSLAGAGWAREAEAMRNAYLWSPRFSQMNDPMEAFYELGGAGDQAVDRLLQTAGKSTADMYEMAKTVIDRLCLVSFSSTPVDLPLWAYYGGNFAGVCLEFDTDRLFVGDLQGESLVPVTYAETALPPLQLWELTSMEAVTGRLSRKRIEWAHEKEWRVLTGAEGPRHYIDEALVRVHLGPRIDKDHARQIRALFDGRPTEVVQGRVNGFSLGFELVQPPTAATRYTRVGSGTLDLDALLWSRDEFEAFLTVPVEQLVEELRRIAGQPNVDAVADCMVSVTRPALLVQVEQKLRNDRIVYERRYYDSRLQRLP